MRVIETTINCTLCPSYFGYFISYDISPLDYSFFCFVSGKRDGIVLVSWVNYLHSNDSIQSE